MSWDNFRSPGMPAVLGDVVPYNWSEFCIYDSVCQESEGDYDLHNLLFCPHKL
jgi:hypothetical protein